MKICIDARSPYSGGITTYTQGLLKNLMAIDKKNEYIILYDAEHGKKGYTNADERIAPSSNIIWRLIWDHTRLSSLLKKEKVDIYHSLKHLNAFKSSTKLIYTIHSAGIHDPNIIGFKLYYLNDIILKFMTKTATCFIAVSKVDKEHFIKWSGVEKERIIVIPLGVDDRFHEINDEDIKNMVRLKYNLPEKFILAVSMFHPIRNIETVVNAYKLAKQRPKIEHKLVIVGAPLDHSYFRRLVEMIKSLGIEDDVIFPGYIKDDLPCVYNLASLFVCPSLYESFGVPILEAMACGTPVIASNVGGIPETYGDAAILVDPLDIEGFAAAIIRVLSLDHLREGYQLKVLERAKIFSWKRCALETLRLYENICNP
jgi:glycosyltransferase involved in cell wall biosynthesis